MTWTKAMKEMRKILLMVACGLSLIFSSCERKNYVYSNASLNRPYEYDPDWDYKGYSPATNQSMYRRYDPERNEAIVKNIKEEGQAKGN